MYMLPAVLHGESALSVGGQSKGKNNGMLDIKWPMGRIHVQNVLNEQISSFLYVIGVKTRTKRLK